MPWPSCVSFVAKRAPWSGVICSRSVSSRARISAVVIALGIAVPGVGCSSSGVARVPSSRPASQPSSVQSVQNLYEAGRYTDVVGTVAAAPQSRPEDIWLAAMSAAKLARQADARALFSRLASSSDEAWQVVARLALALLDGNGEELQRAAAAAEAYPSHPFVQCQLGLARSSLNDFSEAARAFDRCLGADPRFAYAYYFGGIAYERLKRADLTADRLETFLRLAPDAPERPAVESILRTIRGQ